MTNCLRVFKKNETVFLSLEFSVKKMDLLSVSFFSSKISHLQMSKGLRDIQQQQGRR